MRNIVKWDPFEELSALQKQFFGEDFVSPVKGLTIPTTDVYTKDDKLVVEAHLPHFTEDDISVQVDEGVLTISASRHDKEEDKEKKYVLRESSQSFYRRISLPERADGDSIEAHLEDGILKVSVPLTPLPEPKTVAITSGKKKQADK